MFFPRGGSAHVARGLSKGLAEIGWNVTLVSGSRSDLGEDGDARLFYEGIDVRPVDFSPALDGEAGPPIHPSYEDRSGARDRVFASLDDAEYERHVEAWADALEGAGAAKADLLHLHHLTPINEAAERVAGDVPVVGQLHGTELLMLEAIERGAPTSWRYAERWADRMRRWAGRCRRLLVAPGGVDRAAGLLDIERERFVPTPNGFEPDLFCPQRIDRAAHWRRHLVERPRGWTPGEQPGSVAYEDGELDALREGTVLIYVGRFTEVKRLPLLVRAFAGARHSFDGPAGLVLLGGHPGEWEGEHPAETIASSGAEGVFLAGWHGHDVLAEFLNASDVIVMPSVREQFGQVVVEAMACELPAVAARSFGAERIVDDGQTGWLVPPDDEQAMAEALVEAVNDEAERRRRGKRARSVAMREYAWPSVAEGVAAAYGAAMAESGE